MTAKSWKIGDKVKLPNNDDKTWRNKYRKYTYQEEGICEGEIIDFPMCGRAEVGYIQKDQEDIYGEDQGMIIIGVFDVTDLVVIS